MFTRVKSWLKKDSGFSFRMLVSRMSGGDGRDNPKALDCRRLEMAHLQYALLQVCGWYPDQLHTSKIAITPGDLDVTITTIGEVYYSLFVEKYASKYSNNIHRLHVAVTFHSHNISTSLLCLRHRCQFPGCQVALVMDGNMKSWRDVCMAQEAGYIEYEGLQGKIKTGCVNTPEQKSQYCTLDKPRACDPTTRHCSEETPPEPLGHDQGIVQLILEKKSYKDCYLL